MKTVLSTLFVIVFTVVTVSAQHEQTREVSDFTKVYFEGRAKLYLIKGTEPSVKIEAKRDYYLDDFVTKVKNGKLYLKFEDGDNQNRRRIKVYVTYTETIEDLDLNGLVTLISEDLISSEKKLHISADGFIKGKLEVDVADLDVEAAGFVSLTFFGRADKADLELDGFGRINARDLETKSIDKDANGFASIRL